MKVGYKIPINYVWSIFIGQRYKNGVGLDTFVISEQFKVLRICEKCEGRLKVSWSQLLSPSRNFVEGRWLSPFRSTSLAKRYTSYNAPLTSRKRAADCWSLRNFLPRSSLYMVGKPRNLMGWDLDCMANILMGFHRSTFSKAKKNSIKILPHAVSGLFQTRKRSYKARNFKVITGLQHVLEKWVEHCKQCITCQGRYFEKETATTTSPQSSDLE
jgi:hypothetical protein